MKKVNIIIVGASGRMGREIAVCLAEHPRAEFYSGVDLKGRQKSRGLSQIKKKQDLVAIDFSSPRGMCEALDWCIKAKVPFVSGTTGISAADKKKIVAAAEKIPVLWSPNMSYGINLFLEIIEKLGPLLNGSFDMQLEEFHHKQKIDAPSGTAKILQEALERSAKTKLPKIISGRGGGIFGVHKLWLMAEEEVLTIEHTALSRRVFARGAVAAAVWLSSQKPGLYHFQDVIRG